MRILSESFIDQRSLSSYRYLIYEPDVEVEFEVLAVERSPKFVAEESLQFSSLTTLVVPAVVGGADPFGFLFSDCHHFIFRLVYSSIVHFLQLYLLRTMLESLIADKGSTGRKTMRKELDVQVVESIERFHRRSFFYKSMLNFSSESY